MPYKKKSLLGQKESKSTVTIAAASLKVDKWDWSPGVGEGGGHGHGHQCLTSDPPLTCFDWDSDVETCGTSADSWTCMES